MYGYTKWVGIFATIAWLMLSVLTVGGAFLDTNNVGLNLVNGTMFLSVAAYLMWRLRVMASVVRSLPDNPAIASLFRVEAVSATAMLLLGLLLAFAAGTRVLGERLPVFG